MALQLIYTKSRLIHGSLLQRIHRVVQPGYGVVGKTRISRELEDKLVALASRGMGKDRVDTQPQFFYFIDSVYHGTFHIFGSMRWIDQHAVSDAVYIAHFLVLTEEEVREIWKSSCRITPAGVLLMLELDGFWVQSWQGPNRWLNEEANLPNWAEEAASLQAQCQPTWKLYTGHEYLATLPNETQYKKSCMLALPTGTPVQDMLRLLHESDCLRSDLGWPLPIFTHNSRGFAELPGVRFLGFIGSHMKRQAGLFGMPVIEVTEHLAAVVPTLAASAAAPASTAPRYAPTDFTPYDTQEEETPQRHSLVWSLIALGALALCACYVWDHYEEVGDKVSDWFAQAERDRETTQPSAIANEGKTPEVNKELSAEQKQLVHQRIAPISVGQRVPEHLRELFNDAAQKLTSGKIVIYHLNSGDNATSLSCELDGTAYRAVITPGSGGEQWRLEIFERDQLLPGGSLEVTCTEGVLRSISDENGEGVALLLPVTRGEETLYEVLLLPEVRAELPQAAQKGKTRRGRTDNLAQLTPECLTSEPQKLTFSDSPQAKKWESALAGEQSYTASNLLNLPLVARRNHVVIEGDDNGLFPFPLRGEERGAIICYSPQLRVQFDAKQQVVTNVLLFANTPRSSASHKKYDSHSIAGIYYAVTRMIKAPKNKSNTAVTQYAKLFADEDLMAYCEKELGYLTIPYHGGVTGKGAHIKVENKVIEQLMAANFYEMQLCICERLTQKAQTEFARSVAQQCSEAVAGKYLSLREVRVDSPGELTWVFELRNAE